MSQISKSLSSRATVLVIAGLFVLVGTVGFADEPETPAEAQTVPETPQAAPAPAEPAAPQQAVAPKVYQSQWEIVVDGKAENNGTLELVFQPGGSEATLVKINIVAKTNKKEIAKALAKEISFAAGSAYKVKANGNKVKVKVVNKKTRPFHLGIETQSVNGVSVRIGKG